MPSTNASQLVSIYVDQLPSRRVSVQPFLTGATALISEELLSTNVAASYAIFPIGLQNVS